MPLRHDTIGLFPPGRIRSRIDRAQRSFSVHAHLLPFLEQTPIINAINFSAGADTGPENSTARVMMVSVYLCPAETHRPIQGSDAVHNHLMNTGTGYGVVNTDGVCFENSAIGLRDLTDGSSQAVLFSETFQGDGQSLNNVGLTSGNNNSTSAPGLTNYASQCSVNNKRIPDRGSLWII